MPSVVCKSWTLCQRHWALPLVGFAIGCPFTCARNLASHPFRLVLDGSGNQQSVLGRGSLASVEILGVVSKKKAQQKRLQKAKGHINVYDDQHLCAAWHHPETWLFTNLVPIDCIWLIVAQTLSRFRTELYEDLLTELQRRTTYSDLWEPI